MQKKVWALIEDHVDTRRIDMEDTNQRLIVNGDNVMKTAEELKNQHGLVRFSGGLWPFASTIGF